MPICDVWFEYLHEIRRNTVEVLKTRRSEYVTGISASDTPESKFDALDQAIEGIEHKKLMIELAD